MSTLMYDIVKGTVPKSNLSKFQSNFATKVIKSLEKNMVKVIDPECTEESRFKKLDYNLPKDIKELMVDGIKDI